MLIVGDVSESPVFDEVDEVGEVVEDGGEVVFNAVLLKESFILHARSEAEGEGEREGGVIRNDEGQQAASASSVAPIFRTG